MMAVKTLTNIVLEPSTIIADNLIKITNSSMRPNHRLFTRRDRCEVCARGRAFTVYRGNDRFIELCENCEGVMMLQPSSNVVIPLGIIKPPTDNDYNMMTTTFTILTICGYVHVRSDIDKLCDIFITSCIICNCDTGNRPYRYTELSKICVYCTQNVLVAWKEHAYKLLLCTCIADLPDIRTSICRWLICIFGYAI